MGSLTSPRRNTIPVRLISGIGLLIITAMLCWRVSHATLLESSQVSRDFCNMELLNISCRADEVILMESAIYGRMRLGRCVRGNFGHLGCAVDVLRFMDGRCSGRQVCQFHVPDPVLYEMQPCPPDFTSYLDVVYTCVTVAVPAHGSACDAHRPLRISRAQTGYISSPVASGEAGRDDASASTGRVGSYAAPVGTSRCPWFVEAMPGQRINVSMYAFATVRAPGSNGGGGGGAGGSVVLDGGKYSGEYGPFRSDVCFEVAVLADGDARKEVPVCGGQDRETIILLSNTNALQIEFMNPKLSQTIGYNILFKYQVTGCRDLKLVGDAWQQRTGETLTVRCNFTAQTWHLTCKGTDWVGEAGNCSASHAGSGVDVWSLEQMLNADDSFPFGVLLAVAIGVAMGIAIGGVLLCLITTYMKNYRRSQQGYSLPKDQHACLSCPPPTSYSNRSSLPRSLSGTAGRVESTTLPLDCWLTDEPYNPERLGLMDGGSSDGRGGGGGAGGGGGGERVGGGVGGVITGGGAGRCQPGHDLHSPCRVTLLPLALEGVVGFEANEGGYTQKGIYQSVTGVMSPCFNHNNCESHGVISGDGSLMYNLNNKVSSCANSSCSVQQQQHQKQQHQKQQQHTQQQVPCLSSFRLKSPVCANPPQT